MFVAWRSCSSSWGVILVGWYMSYVASSLRRDPSCQDLIHCLRTKITCSVLFIKVLSHLQCMITISLYSWKPSTSPDKNRSSLDSTHCKYWLFYTHQARICNSREVAEDFYVSFVKRMKSSIVSSIDTLPNFILSTRGVTTFRSQWDAVHDRFSDSHRS